MVRNLEYPKKSQNTVKRYNSRGIKVFALMVVADD